MRLFVHLLNQRLSHAQRISTGTSDVIMLSLPYRPAHIVYQENIKTFPLQKVANPEVG
jgi:hypothetical protein